jgi:hypothetical protein
LRTLLISCSKTTDEEINESTNLNPKDKIFAFKYVDDGANSVVQLNPNNGSEIKTIANLGNLYLRIAKYNSVTDEILGEGQSIIFLELGLFACILATNKRILMLLFFLGILFHFSIFILHGLISFMFPMIGALILYLDKNNYVFNYLKTLYYE